MMDARNVPMSVEADAAPEALGFDADGLSKTRELLGSYIGRGHIAGACVLIARHGQVAQLLTAGWADLEAKIPMAADTLFRIFSLTKPVTSVAALMLAEQGAIGLDDPVADYIPAFRDVRVFIREEHGRVVTEPPKRPPTIRHLLTHTSGIAGTAMRSDEPLAAAYRRARIGDERLSLAETCQRLAEIPLLFHPGECWRYGVSTDVLARVVEAASGMGFGAFLRDRLFTPLGMRDTSFAVPQEKRSRLAVLYTASPGGLRPLRHAHAPSAVASADAVQPNDGAAEAGPPVLESGSSGLISTIGDFFRFAQMLLNEGSWQGRQLLRPETVRLMTTNQLPAHLLPYRMPWPHVARYTAGCGFGFGVRVVMDAAAGGLPGAVGEYGWAGAANTYLWIHPSERLVALLFTQAFPFMHTDLDIRFKRLVYEALVR